MNFDIFIKKPILSVALCLFILFIGIAAYLKLPVRQFPLLPSYEVTVTTDFYGASPDVMESFVSLPMQQALSGLDGIDYISSTNTQGQSIVTLRFNLGSDIDAVLPQIANRIAGLLWQLPPDINSPQIAKIDPNAAATGAIMYINTHSDKLSSEQMTEYLQRTIIPRFESIKGVREVQLYGARQYAMRIWLDPLKMAAKKVTASDVMTAIQNHNLRSTAGHLDSKYMRLVVNANTNLASEDAFNDIIIRKSGNDYVRIKDIGEAKLGATQTDDSAYANGKPAVMMGIMVKDRGNSIDTANRIYQSIKELRLPPALNLNVSWDVTQFARESIKEVHLTIIEASIFVFVVIFLFLGSLRSIIVPMITIPLSMLGAAALMWMLGFSLNTLTLLSWVLAIGLVVDDSIVILENIHRHMEMGKTKVQAAIDGVRELQHPIISITLTVAVVFLPIGFVPGIAGALFKQFAFTISLVVIISGILALCVSPVMCTRLLAEHGEKKFLAAKLDYIFSKIRNGYKKILICVLQMKWLVLVIFVGLLLASITLFKQTPSELMPTENEGVVLSIGMGPSNANIDYLERFSNAFSKIYSEIPEKLAYGLFNGIPLVGATNSIAWLLLKPINERQRSEDEIITEVREKISRIPGLLGVAVKQPTVPGAMPGQPIKFVLKTTASYPELDIQLKKLMAAANQHPGLLTPTTTFKMDKTQVDLAINRQKASALGIPVSDIAQTLSIMMGKPVIDWFDIQGYSYEVIPQVFREFRMNPDNIRYMYVKSGSGDMIPLDNLITIKEKASPQSLNQFQQLRSATMQAGIAPGYTMGEVLSYLENYVENNMPHTFSYDYMGQTREFVQSQGALMIAFAFALILIYLFLSVHFNSLKDPLIVMLSVPLAIAGALYFMYLSDSTLNIYTKIGLIMLVGLISKHGILIIDFANNLQKNGKPIQDAIIEAAAIRLRPILMTTAAMICGALPLVLSHGAGSLARSEIGWVIIGGMSLGTFLTLFVVPTAYTVLAKKITP